MASRMFYDTVCMEFCLLLLFFYAVHGKKLLVEKALLPHRNGSSNITSSIQPDEDVQDIAYYAIYRASHVYYYGARAAITAYGLPQVKNDQLSASVLWVISGVGGPKDQISVVQAGMHVHPQLYGDTETHLFTYWTADFYQKTGCYNLDCPGFEPAPDTKWWPGYVVKPLSVINRIQWWLRISITRDSHTGDWMFNLHKDKHVYVIGRWPKSLFSGNATYHADEIQFGGVVRSLPNEPSPPMGSGRRAAEGGRNASCMTELQYMEWNGSFTPFGYNDAQRYAEPPCYSIFSDFLFHKVYYGGPGGCVVKT